MNATLSQAESVDPCFVVERRSIHDHCRYEEDIHKWIESEKMKRDLGEAAIRQWVRDHWDNYLRARWIEHLEGKCFWIELDRGDFGLLKRQIRDRHQLLEPIFEKIKKGQENLNVILWSNVEQKLPDPVREILLLLDCNGRRLKHRFDEPNS